MGCNLIKSKYQFYVEFPECSRGGKAQQYNFLGMKESEVAKMHHLFTRVHTAASRFAKNAAEDHQQRRREDLIRPGDICALLIDQERSRFFDTLITAFARSNKMLAARQRSRTGVLLQRSENGTGVQLNFHSFVLACYNFLTVTRTQMAAWVFDLYDIDESGYLDIHELEQMMRDFHGPTWRDNKNCEQLCSIIRSGVSFASADYRVDHNCFLDFCSVHQTFLAPVFKLQMVMHTSILCPRDWVRLAAHRLTLNYGHCFLPLRTVIEMHREEWDMEGLRRGEEEGKME